MISVTLKFPSGDITEAKVEETSFTLGRSPKNAVHIKSDSVSRHHCQIDLENNSFFITDLGSTNGVLIDGHKIPANTRTPYSTFQSLQIGDLECIIQWEDEGYSAPLQQRYDPEQEDSKTRTKILPSLPKIKVKKKKSYLGPILIGSLFLMTLFFVLNSQEEVPEAPLGKRQVTTAPVQKINLKNISDTFYTDQEYIQYSKKKTCEEKNICKELKLDPKEQEGVVLEKGEVIIIFAGSDHLKKASFESIKSLPEGDALAALFYLARSELFFNFLNKEVGQIHIVLINSNRKIKNILKLHHEDFSGLSQRQKFITDLMEVIGKSSTGDFFQNHKISFKNPITQ